MLNVLENISSKYNEVEELKRILKNKNISTVYQPIVSLLDGTIIGYEALSRGPADSPLQNPDRLFKTAQLNNKTWELEQLCRIKAIKRAANIEKNKYLFINVDPHIFKDEKFKKGFTKEFLAEHNMSPDCIIFEITEKTCIEDYKSFKQALSNYVDQGYKIAIDDTGSGYSGLKMLNETKPHYVKIDMDLIKNINEDSFKQSLLECFVKLSEATNMKLIAEGIETEEELKTLINIRSLLNYTTTLECNYARQLNPLTELPGNTAIQNTIMNAIKTNRMCCILYFDLDNFKIYNDTYGFENGDRILKYTAKLIQAEVKSLLPYNGFIGHIGGDDFVSILENSIEECEKLCEKIMEKFDNGILNFFNERDRNNKYIEAIDRQGKKGIFPLTSISIAGIYGEFNDFSNPEQVGLAVAAIKKEVKLIVGSGYLIKCVE